MSHECDGRAAEPFATLLVEHRQREAADLPASTAAELYGRALARMALGRDADARADLAACEPEFGPHAEIETAFLDARQRSASLSARATALRIAHAEGIPDKLRARALHVLGFAEGRLRRGREAVRRLEEAAEVYRELKDRASMAQVRDTLGSVFAAQGQIDLALGQFAISLFEKTIAGDRAGAAISIGNIGRAHHRAGRFARALDCFELDLALSRELGDRRGEARMLEDVGRTQMALEQLDAAGANLRQAIERAVELSWPELEVFARCDLARVRVREGNNDEAMAECERAAACLPEGSDAYLRAVVLAARGEVLAGAARPEALEALESAAKELAIADVPDLEIPTLLLLAGELSARRYARSAETCLRRALARARDDGFARHLAPIREAMKRLKIVLGAVEERGTLVLPGEEDGRDASGYILTEVLGKGGYGHTWRALDPHRDRVVAVKVLDLEGVYDESNRRRILASARTELEAASRIEHPGIARVWAIGETARGSTYIVQHFVPGKSLRQWLLGRPTASPAHELLLLSADIGHALAVLHAAGVVHRDLKPENVLLTSDRVPRPVLIDFGIAQLPSRRLAAESEFIEGTLEYMAPEQARGERVDGRADVYALGVILYEGICGQRPIRFPPGISGMQPALAELRRARVRPVSQARPDLPREIGDLVHRMLEARSARRPDAAEVAEMCERLAR